MSPSGSARTPAMKPPADGTQISEVPSCSLFIRFPWSAPMTWPSSSNARSSEALGPSSTVYSNGPSGIVSQSTGGMVSSSPASSSAASSSSPPGPGGGPPK